MSITNRIRCIFLKYRICFYFIKKENKKKKDGIYMIEKVYKTMKKSGISVLIFGILTIVFGIGVGVVMIVNGSILLKKKSELMF